MKVIVCVALVAFYSIATPALAACRGQLKDKPTSRFTLDEGEAHDKKTGLIWNRCSVGMHWKNGKGCLGERQFLNLEEATKIAKSAGNGWRLPSVDELVSIVDDKCGTPATDVVVFPDIGPFEEMESPYWTNSSAEVGTGLGLTYFVDFRTGIVDAHTKGFSQAVRLVK
jgi:hypothetical protein